MKAIIISGGNIHNHKYISQIIAGFIKSPPKNSQENNSIIICADSGYDHAVKMSLTPDLIIGDMDSVKSPFSGINVLRYPAEKDFTDTELAVNHAINLGAAEILLLGCTGNRLDHTLANIQLLLDIEKKGVRAEIIDENNKIFLLPKAMSFYEPSGTLISLVPLTDCAGVSGSGLKYPLCNASLFPGASRSICNEIISSPAHISLEKGKLLIIIAKD